MKRRLLTVAMAAGMLFPAILQAQTTLYGITNANAIFTMSDVMTPSAISGPYAISGVASGQVLVGLDARPSTGVLYALGYDSLASMGELYTITGSGSSYTATAVSGTLASLNLGLTNNVAMDFVSTADNQIRIVGRNGNNYIMSALDGTVTSTGTSGLSFGLGDLHSGTGMLAATAYTNNFYGADATQEVGYDAVNNVLVNMDEGSFANGFNNVSNTIHSIGASIGTTLTALGSVGMDTWFDTVTHTNTIYLTGSPLLSGAHLYSYAMGGVSGTITDLGAIGSGSLNVRDIAFQTTRDSVSAAGHLLTGLTLNLRNLVYFNANNPGNILREVTLRGMTAGQEMVGIDYAANGTLYGLGYNSIAHNYQLYTIDSLTGSVTAVNPTAVSLNLGTDDGSDNYINAGFRFISTATNRIRVTGNNGATNATIDATTGAIVSTDAALQYITGDASFGAAPNITSIAFTGYAVDTVTQMFGFDASTGSLVMFDNSNGLVGFGDGSSGFINTDISLNSVLSLLAHTSSYNNSSINIMFDPATMSNIGFMTSNYLGDSGTAQLNYSVLYDMSSMLTAYHKGTTGSPTTVGRIGYGTPLKDIAIRRAAPVSTGIIAYTGNTSNDLLVYPNPVISQTRVVLDVTPVSDVFVDIIDLNGRVDRSFQYAPGTNLLDIDMSRLPTGLYSVRVSGNDIGFHNLKVVKE